MSVDGEGRVSAIEKGLLDQLEKLPDELKERVLEFARALAQSSPRGVAGAQLLRLAGTIPGQELALMSRAIDEGCEQVGDEWRTS